MPKKKKKYRVKSLAEYAEEKERNEQE